MHTMVCRLSMILSESCVDMVVMAGLSNLTEAGDKEWWRFFNLQGTSSFVASFVAVTFLVFC